MRAHLINRYLRILRVFFTFGAIGFVQFINPAAAADPACKVTPETWTENRSKAQGAKENKAGEKVVPDTLQRQQIRFFRKS
jgi:hypothetical protein